MKLLIRNRQSILPALTFLLPVLPPILSTILLAVSPVSHATDEQLIKAIGDLAEPFESAENADLDQFLGRVGDARFVLLGESSHGSQEFYEMRARISQALIEKKGFNIIALEADWPDVTRIEHFIQSDSRQPLYRQQPFSTFPRWMWLNQPFIEFTSWLKQTNGKRDDSDRIHIYGLDLYNLSGSIRLVLDYLTMVDQKSAAYAWQQYRCLLPIAEEPGMYGEYVNMGRHPVCRQAVVNVYRIFLDNAQEWSDIDPNRYFYAQQNALLAVKGEYFYRAKLSDADDAERDTWNYREKNLLTSAQDIMKYHGDDSKVIIWAHNTHVGDSRATNMIEDERHSLGERVRIAFPHQSYIVGFATHTGTVTAAPGWNRAAQVMQVPASREDSFEYLIYRAEAENFFLPLRDIEHEALSERFSEQHGQRAIGVAYDPEDELKKHYIGVVLAEQFDELIWFEQTEALQPPKLPGARAPIDKSMAGKSDAVDTVIQHPSRHPGWH